MNHKLIQKIKLLVLKSHVESVSGGGVPVLCYHHLAPQGGLWAVIICIQIF
ncbi:hypothetical protein JQ310_19520 [Leptospira interrogans]|nr:hypothetical protein [Leptospira interrogans]